jgi:hypothetical protein
LLEGHQFLLALLALIKKSVNNHAVDYTLLKQSGVFSNEEKQFDE